MKSLLAALMLLALAVPAFAADKATDSKENAAIRKATEDFFAAWNKNDVPTLATFFADDATLINPFGRMAQGKTEIQQLLGEEQAGLFKGSVATVGDVKTRHIGPNLAFIDTEVTVDGAHGADGSAMPQMKFHMASIAQMKGNKWQWIEARPYVFLPPVQAQAAAGNGK